VVEIHGGGVLFALLSLGSSGRRSREACRHDSVERSGIVDGRALLEVISAIRDRSAQRWAASWQRLQPTPSHIVFLVAFRTVQEPKNRHL